MRNKQFQEENDAKDFGRELQKSTSNKFNTSMTEINTFIHVSVEIKDGPWKANKNISMTYVNFKPISTSTRTLFGIYGRELQKIKMKSLIL